MCFDARILENWGIPLPYEDGFSKVKNSYIKSAYYNTCDDNGKNTSEIWMNGDLVLYDSLR